jgi:type I restriction enzyme, S subunit
MKLPNGWKNRNLNDLVSLQRGYDLPAQDRKKGCIPVIGGGGHNGYHSIAKADGPGVIIGRSGAGFGTAFFSEVPF